MMSKESSRESLHILKDGANDIQVGDFEQATIYNVFKLR